MSEPSASHLPFSRGVVARPWLLVFLPANAAAAGFSVALPLLILLPLHGDVLEVALAVTLYNVAIIPASLLWGVACDRLGVRAPLLLLNYVAFAGVFLVLARWPSLPVLLVVYTAYGFIAPSSAAASNLLILERFPASERPSAFASFSELSTLGNVAGILLGFLLLLRAPNSGLFDILYVSSAISLVSAVGVALFVRDAPVLHRRAQLARHADSLVARLHLRFPYFPHPPSRGFFRRAAKWLETEATHEVPLMLAGGFFFGLGSGLFNTSYTPYLASIAVPAAGIFLVNLSNNGFQAALLPFTARACEGERAGGVVQAASWGRVVGYLGAFSLALLPLSFLASGSELGANLLVYGLIGVTFAFYSTASSLLLFRSLEGRNAGSLLGANSALGGLAAVLGSAGSGVVSHLLGFAATFLLGAVCVGCAVPAWVLALRAYLRRRNGAGRTGTPQSA
ncbi:MAG: MFS transporter [Euryarchaeota archaeon]|nr:MFS transporter [Euryarchaeota archaeon]MDE1835492.1 MFS transporter [Euryarchaeota archaeon]MDE1880385.1 MFS transporter [Euryarchaeota archaeon]MDE2045773.1 MFS transporter [Thermoplasmata archaeon]